MKTLNLLTIFASLALLAGCETSVTTPVICVGDAGIQGDAAPDSGTDSGIEFFTLSVIQPVELVPGEDTVVLVEVLRADGYTSPVLLEVSGLPDAVTSHDRENRQGEATTEIYLHTDEQGPGDFRIPRFTVSATDGTGLRHTVTVDFTVVE